MTYIAGDPKRCCERCGGEFRVSTTRKEWSGLIVCSDCFDPRPVHLEPPKVSGEGLPIRDPRPEPPPWFVTDNEITPEDL